MNLGPVKETATTEDSESLLKIKALVYYDFVFVERKNRLEKRNGRSRKLLANSIFCAPATTAGVERFLV